MPTSEVADADTRHAIYSALIKKLSLSVEHRQSLKLRGLDDWEINTRNYRTLPARPRIGELRKKFTDEQLLTVPGFVVRTNRRSGEQFIALQSFPGILVPCRDAAGRIVACKVRLDVDDGAGKYRYLSSGSKGGPKADCAPHVPLRQKSAKPICGPLETVRVTEGELKADTATALNAVPTISVPGVANWRGVIDVLKTLQVRRVLLAFDADAATNPEVADHLRRCVEGLSESGFTVHMEVWQSELGKGIDDLLAGGGTPEVLSGDAVGEYLSALPARPEGSSTTNGGRKDIIIDTDEHRVNDEVCEAMANDSALYRRAGVLVRVVRDTAHYDGIERADIVPRINEAPLPWLRDRITRHVAFSVYKEKDGELILVPAHPPDWSVKAFAANGDWPKLRRLEGIVTAPTLRADGSLLTEAGYDPRTGLLLEPSGEFPPIPSTPTQEDAIRAAEVLLDVIADFPFERDEHRAAAVAFILTPLARYAFAGPSPLFLVDANVRGSGKTLLCDVAGLIATGRGMSRMSNPSDDDECRKRITSLVIAGDVLVLIDNITGSLGCASLDAALTAETWKDRILGRSEVIEAPLRIVWCASGNNVMLAADTARRVLHVRLRSPDENPELRTGFRHADLRKHVREHRGELLAAGLTILAAYIRAGWPSQGLPPWGSFEGWSDLVRNAVVWCGLPDPGETRQELVSQSDTQAMALGQLLESWREIDPESRGIMAGELLDTLALHRLDYEGVRDAILELCGGTADKLPSVRAVGNKLRHLRGRVVGGKHLDSRQDRRGVQVWYVANAGSAGSEGSVSPHPYAPACAHARVHTHADRPKTEPSEPAEPALNGRPDPAYDDPSCPRQCRPDMACNPPWVNRGGANSDSVREDGTVELVQAG